MTDEQVEQVEQARWWPRAAATGIGSYPGTDIRDTAQIVTGELPSFLHLPELPARGPGSDAIGRTAGLLSQVDGSLGLETTPTGWRISGGMTREMRRAVSWLSEDLDVMEEASTGYEGAFKLQLVGPWTFAASVELPGGERALRDHGAVAHIAGALGEAVNLHVADLQRRLPGASVVVQWDEPALPAVMGGTVGTASGLATYRAVSEPRATEHLRTVLQALPNVIAGVHCCAPSFPIDAVRTAGAKFISFDILDARPHDDAVGRAWESGVGVLVGCVPALGHEPGTQEQLSRPIRRYLADLGFTDPDSLDRMAITPTCGLAGASPAWVRHALAACQSIGRIVRDDHLGDGQDEPDER
jgi:hypothetical protein